MNELPAVKKPSVFKRNLIATAKLLTELYYCMDYPDSIVQITENVDDAIQQAKLLLAPTEGGLIIIIIDGFRDPVLYDHFVPGKGKFVQVLNVNKNHWVCVAGEGNNEIHIYDSLLIKINNKSMHVIATMSKCDDEVFLTKTVPVQKQSNSSDRGLFALAFAFDLANNLDPSIITYKEKILRKHLLPCIENEEITEFLKTNERLARTKIKHFLKPMKIFVHVETLFF